LCYRNCDAANGQTNDETDPHVCNCPEGSAKIMSEDLSAWCDDCAANYLNTVYNSETAACECDVSNNYVGSPYESEGCLIDCTVGDIYSMSVDNINC